MRARTCAVTRAVVPLVKSGSSPECFKTVSCATRLGHFVADPHAVCPRGGSTPGHWTHYPCRTARPVWQSSLEVPSSSRVSTRSTRRPSLDVRHLSWASFPYSACSRRSLRCVCRPVPIWPTTFRPQGSRPLDGLLLHPPRHAFPRSNTPGVVPTGVHSSRTGPPASAGGIPLMAFLPQPARSRPRNRENWGRDTG